MQYFSKHKLHAVCKMSVEVCEINVHLTSKTTNRDAHKHSHAIVVLSLAPLGAKVFSSQLQQTSIWSCERNPPFVTTELVVEQRCTEKTLVLLGFRGFAQKTNHTEYHPQRVELTAN